MVAHTKEENDLKHYSYFTLAFGLHWRSYFTLANYFTLAFGSDSKAIFTI